MRLIGVDVDITICPSDVGWERYLKENSACKYPLGDYEIVPYDLSKQYCKPVDPYKYWRELDYSQFTPIEGSVEKLKSLSQYFGIVFISSIKGVHTKSKYYWLKEHFPFMEGYIATKEKFLMSNSVVAMIDDRKDILEKFDLEKRVLYDSPYSQTVDCPVSFRIQSWKEFSARAFCEMYLV